MIIKLLKYSRKSPVIKDTTRQIFDLNALTSSEIL